MLILRGPNTVTTAMHTVRRLHLPSPRIGLAVTGLGSFLILDVRLGLVQSHRPYDVIDQGKGSHDSRENSGLRSVSFALDGNQSRLTFKSSFHPDILTARSQINIHRPTTSIEILMLRSMTGICQTYFCSLLAERLGALLSVKRSWSISRP